MQEGLTPGTQEQNPETPATTPNEVIASNESTPETIAPIVEEPESASAADAILERLKEMQAQRLKELDAQTEIAQPPVELTSETKADVSTDVAAPDTSIAQVAEGVYHAEAAADEPEEVVDAVDLNLETKDIEGLLTLLEEFSKDVASNQNDDHIRQIKAAYDNHAELEKASALEKFRNETGETEGFEFKPSGTSVKFESVYRAYRVARKAHLSGQEKERNENFEKKKVVLEKLRALVESESAPTSIQKLRDIQKSWNEIGPVAPSVFRELSQNYHALVDRFFDNFSIFRELRELDHKKNREAKEEIIKKAEELLNETQVVKAITASNELFKEYKNIGPGGNKEENDALWNRFFEVRSTIRKRFEEWKENRTKQEEENYAAKWPLAEKAELLSAFDSDRMVEWNKTRVELQKVEEEWKKIGPVPADKADAIKSKFYGSIRKFYAGRSAFFAKLDKERAENLKLKTDLCIAAEELQNSVGIGNATEEMITLQNRWKEIGPVSKKDSDAIYERFKKAMDAFFNKKREANQSARQEEEGNLASKNSLIDELTALAEGEVSIEKVSEIKAKYLAIGFVPFKAKEDLSTRFRAALTKAVDKIDGLSDSDKFELKSLSGNEGGQRRGGPKGGGQDRNRNFNQTNDSRGQEFAIKKKIAAVENQMHSYQNNMAFFANSRNADLLRKEVEKKVEVLSQELAGLKEQLKNLQSTPKE